MNRSSKLLYCEGTSHRHRKQVLQMLELTVFTVPLYMGM